MATLKTKFAVGLFVIIGFALSFVAVIWFGLSHYLEKGHYYVAYFDESVQGLDRDSPVKYRGVSVGRVESIEVAPDATLIQTVMKIEPEIKPDENFVAQLKSVGITGIMFVELDRKKPGEPDLSPRINFPSKYPVIATKPSEIRQFITEINEVLNQLKSLDLGGISAKVKENLDELNRSMTDLDLADLSMALKSSLAVWDRALNSVDRAAQSIQKMADNGDRTVNELASLIEASKADLKAAVAALNRSMQQAETLVSSGSALLTNTDRRIEQVALNLVGTLRMLEQSGENLNRTVERIADQPSQLIFSEPPRQRKIEPES
jgi:phospholipid/cholesterol/gamma-HCH transport system substrate-binding protein